MDDEKGQGPGVDSSTQAPDDKDRGSLINLAFVRGRRQHPGLLVTRDVLAKFLMAKGDFPPAALADASSAPCLEDLYLACACAEGIDGAIARFDEVCGAAIASHLPASSAEEVDEVRQRLRHHLFIGTPGGVPRIRQYSGRARLATWSGIVARRIAMSMYRSRRVDQRHRGDLVVEALSTIPDPEVGFVKEELRPHFVAAMKDALAALSLRDLGLLKMHLIGGMSMETLGSLHAVNASTISRWLQSARQRLHRDSLLVLKGRLGLNSDELQSILRLAPSDIEVSISQILVSNKIAQDLEK